MFAMPNIAIQEPIGVEGLALVPTNDERVKVLAKKHRRFATYLMSSEAVSAILK